MISVDQRGARLRTLDAKLLELSAQPGRSPDAVTDEGGALCELAIAIAGSMSAWNEIMARTPLKQFAKFDPIVAGGLTIEGVFDGLLDGPVARRSARSVRVGGDAAMNRACFRHIGGAVIADHGPVTLAEARALATFYNQEAAEALRGASGECRRRANALESAIAAAWAWRRAAGLGRARTCRSLAIGRTCDGAGAQINQAVSREPRRRRHAAEAKKTRARSGTQARSPRTRAR